MQATRVARIAATSAVRANEALVAQASPHLQKVGTVNLLACAFSSTSDLMDQLFSQASSAVARPAQVQLCLLPNFRTCCMDYLRRCVCGGDFCCLRAQ